MSDAKRDQNDVPTLLGVSQSDGTTPVLIYADPVTHRLLVDSAGGIGTVTSVSVVTANGFSGSVANPTTTPAITLSTSLTVNGKAISSNPVLSLASADFANQGTTTTVLHGNAAGNPAFSAVVEADITLSNNTTNNATTSKHGFLPILPGNALQFLDGSGNYSTPTAGVANSYSLTSFSGQTSVNVIHNFGTYPVVQVIDNTGAVIVPLTTVNNTLNDFTVTFSISTSGSIIASVGSPQPQAVTVASGNYTILVTDRIITATGGGSTITLPTAVGNTGREFIIDNAGASNITVNTTGGQTIEGDLTQTIPTSSAINVYSTGAVWRIY